MTIYRTDGTSLKALSLDSLLGSGFEQGLLRAASTPAAYYAIVPYVRRAANLRANAVASVPLTLERRGVDVSGKAEWRGLMQNLRTVLRWTEFAVCLSPNGATWRKVTNRVGTNPTPEWLLPSAVYPVVDAALGLTSVRYTRPFGVSDAGTIDYLALDEVVRFWLPNLERANWPGPPPGITALAAAGVLANKDSFLENYFQRGAIKSVLLQVPPDSKPADRDRLTTWWRSMTNGIGNAWRSVVVSTAVTPVVLGDGLKDMNNAELTREYRQEVAAAFDVPQSMLMQDSANYATAQIDRVSFYEETVFPEVAFLVEAINEQWLRPAYDAALVMHPEQTEARQVMQLEQAASITNLVGQPVMTVNEGRAWLGLEPLGRDDEAPGDPDADEASDYDEMERDEDDADKAEDAAELVEDEEDEDDTKRYARDATGKYVRLPGSNERSSERATLKDAHRAARNAAKERHANERTAARQRHIAERQQATDAKARLQLVHRQKADLATIRARQRAERLMLRSLQTAERERVRARHGAGRSAELATWTPTKHVKRATETLTPRERRLARLLMPVLEKYGEQAVTAVLENNPLDLALMSAELRTTLISELADVALASMTGMAKELRYGIDPATVATTASQWAKDYTYQLVNGLTQTSQTALQSVMSDFLSTVGMTREQVVQALAPTFGVARAEVIAVTETTRAAAAGVELTRQEIAKAGIAMVRIWRTSNDELTCPVCAPLNGTDETVWAGQYPDGPPAHPNCRCAMTLRVKSNE